MRNFLQQALKDHDFVVVDAPPVLPVADTQVLVSLTDAALLVVRADRAPYELARKAAELLQPKAAGVIVNAVKRVPHNRYYYGYYQNRRTPSWSKS
jgi:Mrp family chromosome partitioning ATPase